MLLLRQAPLLSRRPRPGMAVTGNHPSPVAGRDLRCLLTVCCGHGRIQHGFPAPAVGAVRGRCLRAGRRGRPGLEIVAVGGPGPAPGHRWRAGRAAHPAGRRRAGGSPR